MSLPTLESEIVGFEVFARSVTQQQVGTNMGTNLSTQTQTVGSVVRNTNIQPFMRSRSIQVTARGMKPSTRIYAFFDGVDVGAFMTPTNSSFVASGAEGSALTTDASGNFYGIFRLPNQNSIRFRTGEKVFRLTDNPTNADGDGLTTTASETIYAAMGLISQGATPATQVPTQTPPTPAPTPSNVNAAVLRLARQRWVDPIAQSFTIDTKAVGLVESSGAFITKVDLYFSTKDSIQPVIIEIRELDPITGYPTQKVLPYSRKIVESARVNVSSDGSKPTVIYFDAPVFVEDGKSYALAILPGGGTPNYRVWVSRLGDDDLLTQNRITAQPAAGMLFASSNDLTYTALQNEDLKFKLWFANFNVSTTGSAIFKNETRDYLQVANLSLSNGFTRVGEWVHGETYIKGTLAPGQGIVGNVASGLSYAQGMTSGATGVLTYISTANGDMRLRNVTGAFRGGEAIRFRLTSNTGTIAGNSTGGIKFAQYPKGRVVHYDPTTRANTYLHLANVTYSNSGPSSGTAANNRTFLANRWIKGQVDGVRAKITVLDRLNADVLNFKADYLQPSNTTFTASGKFATSTSARDSTFTTININADTELSARRYIHSESAEANTSLTSATMKDGSGEIKLSFVTHNRYASPAIDLSRISATIIETLLNNTTTGEANTVAGGSAVAKYISRKMVLAEGQDAEDIKVYLDAYNPPGTDVSVYYKVLHAEDSDTFDKARWIQMSRTTANTEVSASEDRSDFRELSFDVPDYPTGSGQYDSGLYGNSTPSNVLAYRNSLGALFFGYKYLAIKVVLTGTSTINPPRIRNLRVIALQK